MAKQKKPVHRVQMTEGKRNIIHQLLEEYDIQTAEDIQDALRDLLGGTIKEMMEAEMDDHLGYEKSARSDNDDYRNGYKRKQVNSSYGSMEIEVPQDRKSTFQPQVVKKRQKDISDIDQKIISMYAKGMTTRQISETIEDIYGFETSEGFISDVTDKILPQIEDWQNRPLDEIYPILFIDAIHYSVRDNGVIRKLAAYVILGINTEGRKEVHCFRKSGCNGFLDPGQTIRTEDQDIFDPSVFQLIQDRQPVFRTFVIADLNVLLVRSLIDGLQIPGKGFPVFIRDILQCVSYLMDDTALLWQHLRG